MNNKKMIEILEKINKDLISQSEYLNELDNKIGDGDHGTNMTRGFGFVIDKIKEDSPESIGKTFSLVGKTLLSKVGGASGPLYGMIFLKSGIKDQSNFDYDLMSMFVDNASKVINSLGKANLNDKTMFDVWKRCAEDFKKNESLDTILNNLEINRDNTKDIMALRGRASFLKERSIGTMDPGCVSSCIIISNLIKGLS